MRTAALTIALVALLAWFGPALDDHSDEVLQAQALEDAARDEAQRLRFERAAQAICGPQAGWKLLADDTVQCFTKRGRPTLTAQVQP